MTEWISRGSLPNDPLPFCQSQAERRRVKGSRDRLAKEGTKQRERWEKVEPESGIHTRNLPNVPSAAQLFNSAVK